MGFPFLMGRPPRRKKMERKKKKVKAEKFIFFFLRKTPGPYKLPQERWGGKNGKKGVFVFFF